MQQKEFLVAWSRKYQKHKLQMMQLKLTLLAWEAGYSAPLSASHSNNRRSDVQNDRVKASVSFCCTPTAASCSIRPVSYDRFISRT